MQGIGFLCGILVIRVLPTEEYALYTLANTMLGTMTVLADGGIASGVLSEGGKVWGNRSKLGSVIATGIHLRKRFAVGSLTIAVPILLYLLLHHGASWLTAVLLILSLIPAFFSALSGKILEITPKLHQDIVSLQKIQVGSNLGRLGLLGLTIFVFPWAYIAILAAGLPQIWANFQIRKRSKKYSEANAQISPEVQKNILKLVKRILPGAIYYAFSGQIIIWLVSIFGNAQYIAQVGAIGRLMVLLTIVKSIFEFLLVPRFAKIEGTRSSLSKNFFLSIAMVALVCFLLISAVYFFPKPALFVLGEKYRNLETEIFLMTTASCIAMLSSCMNSLIVSKGIVPNPVFFIPTVIIGQILILLNLDYSSLAGILYFSIFSACIGVTYRIIHFLNYVYKL
ncbi:MAG: polysaccharide biosynthesis protein [Bacteroidota bacterium]